MPTRRRSSRRVLPASCRAAPGCEAELIDLDFAGVEGVEAVDAAQQRALAAAGGADDRGHLAAADGERDAVEDAQGAVVLYEVADVDHGVIARSKLRR